MKLKQARETETFINELGYYAIKQDAYCERCNEDHSAVIQLTPGQMRLIISDMKEALKIQGEWFSDRDMGV